jgi:hypothetical protein
MSFLHAKNGSLAVWLWCAIFAIVSRAGCELVIQAVNKQMNIWDNKKGGLAGWLWYAIVVVVLIIILILALRFLFGII